MIHLLRALRSHHYDLVVSCEQPGKASFTTQLLCLWTGARMRCGFENVESEGLLNIRVPPVSESSFILNTLQLLSPFGDVPKESIPCLKVDPIQSANPFEGGRHIII